MHKVYSREVAFLRATGLAGALIATATASGALSMSQLGDLCLNTYETEEQLDAAFTDAGAIRLHSIDHEDVAATLATTSFWRRPRPDGPPNWEGRLAADTHDQATLVQRLDGTFTRTRVYSLGADEGILFVQHDNFPFRFRTNCDAVYYVEPPVTFFDEFTAFAQPAEADLADIVIDYPLMNAEPDDQHYVFLLATSYQLEEFNTEFPGLNSRIWLSLHSSFNYAPE